MAGPMRVRRSYPQANAARADPFASWQLVAGVATGILGLGAYVYLLGGTVIWLRAVAARLPADNVIAVTQSRVLLAAGVRTLFFEIALAGVLALSIPLVVAAAKAFEGDDRDLDRTGTVSELALAVVLRAVIAGLVLCALLGWVGVLPESGERLKVFAAMAILWCAGELFLRTYTMALVPTADLMQERAEESPPFLRRHTRGLQLVLIGAILAFAWFKTAATLGVAITVSLVLLLLVNRFPLSSVPRRARTRRRVLAVAISALAINIVIVTYTANPPVTLDRATVTMAKGTPIVGAYLGRTSDGVYLAVCTPAKNDPDQSRAARIVTIPAEQVTGVEVGGYYSFDVGRRPTLWGLGRHFLTGVNLGKESGGADLDLREERAVCGV